MRADAAAARSKAAKIARQIARGYPDATCALHHRNALELLVATILSAQCTDRRVNIVTRSLFRKYRTAKDYAGAEPKELEREIHSAGFFRNKSRSILGAARILCDRHGGRVPSTLEELIELPGVARKTANVVLGTWFGKAEGVVVDTHVLRLSRRLGLSRQEDPKKVEIDLMQLLPRSGWIDFSHRMIRHGRLVCHARKPDCGGCFLKKMCPSAGKVP